MRDMKGLSNYFTLNWKEDSLQAPSEALSDIYNLQTVLLEKKLRICYFFSLLIDISFFKCWRFSSNGHFV